ncbi:MAG: hypothetical protein ACOVMQ_11260 [Cyclobacteriaceae bacterium]|jgi:hypothetical protein
MMLLHTLLILGFVYLFYRQLGKEQPILFSFAFISKAAGAIFLGYYYLHYAPANDTWSFFQMGCEVADLARKDVSAYVDFVFTSQYTATVTHWLYFEDRTSAMVKFISFFCWIGGNNYWVCALYFSLISFLASWFLYFQIRNLKAEYVNAAAVALFFIPSVIFWGSGVVKETLAFAGILYLTALFVRWASGGKFKWWHGVLIIPALFFTWVFKYYWLAVFMAVLIPTAILIFVARKKALSTWQWISSWSVIFIVLVAIVSLAHPNFYLSRILLVVVANHDRYVELSSPDNVIHYSDLEPTVTSVLQNSPLALVSGLWRPFVWEARNPSALIASIETLMILVITLSILFSFRKKINISLIFPLLVYSATLCIFLALSTPNFGTLSRYRIGFLPFFVFAALQHNPFIDKLIKRISFLKNR